MFCQFVVTANGDSIIIINADEKKLVEAGMPVPSIKLYNIDNDTTSLDSLFGKYILLNIWHTRCGSCIKNIPNIDSILTRYSDVIVVNISVDEDLNKWKEVVKARNFKGVHLLGYYEDIPIRYFVMTKFKFKNEDGIIYGMNYPHYVLIDKQGIIMYNNTPNINPKNWKFFSEILKKK
ncbi:MAG TPA: hypothetical protein DDX39_05765 [Bacteroidales bacterium]|nr:MAG: hypothetical protein A2W98_07035 [Bacteroidetes bacterium GWF2_33_38]OFY68590.1 MAG: hypothetical protein A2265_02685 [Bacteroidetes bacterium RIFOXYA12_FULL_33_9]OFY91973.1 MAG: hypothetical protein A2236_13605 [Bacteroidetes bacterium RIFOXYA2_FULL_33_7]HBF88131.1 hypothetical protein [Bacteroidales bacterium]